MSGRSIQPHIWIERAFWGIKQRSVVALSSRVWGKYVKRTSLPVKGQEYGIAVSEVADLTRRHVFLILRQQSQAIPLVVYEQRNI